MNSSAGAQIPQLGTRGDHGRHREAAKGDVPITHLRIHLNRILEIAIGRVRVDERVPEEGVAGSRRDGPVEYAARESGGAAEAGVEMDELGREEWVVGVVGDEDEGVGLEEGGEGRWCWAGEEAVETGG